MIGSWFGKSLETVLKNNLSFAGEILMNIEQNSVKYDATKNRLRLQPITIKICILQTASKTIMVQSKTSSKQTTRNILRSIFKDFLSCWCYTGRNSTFVFVV